MSMIGKKVPDVQLFRLTAAKALEGYSSTELFANKKVVLFSLPGAFTPTCSTSHAVAYQQAAGHFAAAGVDEILCMSVNDAFVMDAWRRDQGVPATARATGGARTSPLAVDFVADGNGTFTKGMGMLVDKSAIGFGPRSWRYSALVNDGTVEKVFEEDRGATGDPFAVSDANTMYRAITGKDLPPVYTMLSREGCGYCTKAKEVFASKGLAYEEIPINAGGSLRHGTLSMAALQAISGKSSTPQIFAAGKLIGGYDELVAHLG